MENTPTNSLHTMNKVTRDPSMNLHNTTMKEEILSTLSHRASIHRALASNSLSVSNSTHLNRATADSNRVTVPDKADPHSTLSTSRVKVNSTVPTAPPRGRREPRARRPTLMNRPGLETISSEVLFPNVE